MRKDKLILLGGLALGLTLTASASADSHASWTDHVTVGGDLRFRHERIDADGSDIRNRQRIRARLSVDGQVDDEFSLHFRLASGSDDPVSANQTLDGGFSTKDFNLDRAYVKYAPEDCNASLTLGKIKNPFYRIQDLVWDSDLNPEGGALTYKMDVDGAKVWLVAAGLWGEERSSDDDTILWAGQLGVDVGVTDDTSVVIGGGYQYWDNTEGFSTLFDEGDSFGNTTTTDASGATVYASDYGIFEVFTEVRADVGMPIKGYFEYALNTEEDVSDEDQAYIVGVTVGSAKKAGDWALDYNFREVEADSLIGAYVDSDSGGGGTDLDGHRVKFKYGIADSVQGVVTVFVNETGISSSATESDYNRVMVDLVAKI